ncbi:RNA 3'-terminal phosphate cyclase [Candidatus Woesearchaeota archaeon]|nr:RNA 3'-terminal phosphate cyclase [Candidatus Woesearchaeota archaeon]
MISIEGDYLEGGGQIIRTALAMSALTGKAFEAADIRKARSNPGIKAQHLHCIKALEQLCDATTEGAELGSTRLKFIPGSFRAKNLEIDIGTAGSISLLLQSLLVPLMFSGKKCKLTLTGGTSGKWQMPFDYFINVFAPHLRKFARIDAKLLRRGYYPKGGGKVELRIDPKSSMTGTSDPGKLIQEIREYVKPIDLAEQGELLQIKGISHASTKLENANVAERQAREAANMLKARFDCPVNVQTEYADTYSPGSGITLWAIFAKSGEDVDFLDPVIIGSDAIGERGKPAEKVGRDAAQELAEEINSKAAADQHLEDNIIPFLALAGGRIKVAKLTDHTRTNMYIVEKFLGGLFDIDEQEKIIQVKREK